MPAYDFDPAKAFLRDRPLFQPFEVTEGQGKPLREQNIPDREELILFERGGERRGLILRQMAYHHAAQGELAGEPYLVSF